VLRKRWALRQVIRPLRYWDERFWGAQLGQDYVFRSRRAALGVLARTELPDYRSTVTEFVVERVETPRRQVLDLIEHYNPT
jgi:hypothetical protein